MVSAGPFGACSANGTQTRTETWARTVITQPANGGMACGPLTETRTGTQACTPPVTDYVMGVTATGTTSTATVTPVPSNRPNAGAGPVVGVAPLGSTPGSSSSRFAITSTTLFDTVIVSADTGVGAMNLRPMVVTQGYVEVRLAPPVFSVELAVTVPTQASGQTFMVQFAASLGTGPIGPYQSQSIALPPCIYTVSPVSSLPASAGNFSVNVTTATGCSWTASSPSSHITLASGSPGSGTGTAVFNFTANPTASIRSGTIRISYAGGMQDVVIAQAAACVYSASVSTVPVGAGSFNVLVTAGTGCSWTASSQSSHITLASGSPGSGNGTAVFNITANTTATVRPGTIRISYTGGSQDIPVQQAAGCVYTVPSTVTLPGSAGNFNVAVGTSTGCAWTASSLSSHITLVSGSPASGTTAVFSITANTQMLPRPGTVRISYAGGSQDVSVQQNPTGPVLINLQWDSGVDMDLHVIEPNGTHVYYAVPNGITARLVRDDSDGFGPEIISVQAGQAAAGIYQVYIVQFPG